MGCFEEDYKEGCQDDYQEDYQEDYQDDYGDATDQAFNDYGITEGQEYKYEGTYKRVIKTDKNYVESTIAVFGKAASSIEDLVESKMDELPGWNFWVDNIMV